MATTNKRIQMKDGDNNKLYPDIQSSNIPANAVKYQQLDADLQSRIDGKADNTDLTTLKATVDKLDGSESIDGSVKQQIKTAVANLVGSAPATLDTLQEIAAEMTDPANSSAVTVLDQVAGKADKATTLAGYGITDAYSKTEVDTTLNTLKASLIYYEEVTA